MALALILILLAQAPGKWVDLEVCFLDPVKHTTSASGHTLSLWIAKDSRPAIGEIYPKTSGPDCVRLLWQGRDRFVVGTRKEVKRKLDAAVGD